MVGEGNELSELKTSRRADATDTVQINPMREMGFGDYWHALPQSSDV